ncbi:phosphoketolase, partial [Candidatus Saccharibacteria bacterium]|nr:phosphoketolase [Candidatus Saccharibacteria bacterium]
GPTIAARSSERELHQILRGCGYTPIVTTANTTDFQIALDRAKSTRHPFIIFRNEKGATGPTRLNGQKIAGNYLSHQIPLPAAKTDPAELAILEEWLKSYKFTQLFSSREGFII